jgi:hypothetical protein
VNDTHEIKFKSDIPNDSWLQQKREDAELSGRNQFGVPKTFGPVTGRFDRDLYVSIEMLAVLPGERGEQASVREQSLNYLRANWSQVSKQSIYVEIDPFGKPWVNEGNHRIMVAKEMGNSSLPTEVKYFAGSDRLVPSEWSPSTLTALDLVFRSEVEAITTHVKDGNYSGMVLDVSAKGIVTQKVNRNGDTVQHDLRFLSEPVVAGCVVDIQYQNGKGQVASQAVAITKGR